MDTELYNSETNPTDISANILPSDPEEPSQALRKCPHCGAVFAADAALCPDCQWPLTPLTVTERAVAAAAYIPVLPAAVILLLPAFRTNRFVRFHAWQSLSLWIAFLGLCSAALLLSNIAAAIVFLLVGILASLAIVFLWIVLSLKAWQGQRFELPLFGELAARLK